MKQQFTIAVEVARQEDGTYSGSVRDGDGDHFGVASNDIGAVTFAMVQRVAFLINHGGARVSQEPKQEDAAAAQAAAPVLN